MSEDKLVALTDGCPGDKCAFYGRPHCHGCIRSLGDLYRSATEVKWCNNCGRMHPSSYKDCFFCNPTDEYVRK